MATKKLLLAALAFAGTAAFAQAPVGTVVNVNGVVTATTGTTGTTVAPGTAIQNGMRFVTTSNASVTLRLNSGCQVTVPPGHGVTVLSTMTCQQLTAAVQPVVPVAAQASAGPLPGTVGTVIGGVGALIAVGILASELDDDDDEPLSAQ